MRSRARARRIVILVLHSARSGGAEEAREIREKDDDDAEKSGRTIRRYSGSTTMPYRAEGRIFHIPDSPREHEINIRAIQNLRNDSPARRRGKPRDPDPAFRVVRMHGRGMRKIRAEVSRAFRVILATGKIKKGSRTTVEGHSRRVYATAASRLRFRSTAAEAGREFERSI